MVQIRGDMRYRMSTTHHINECTGFLRLQGDSPYQSRYGESASLCITDVCRVGRVGDTQSRWLSVSPICRVANSPYHRYAESATLLISDHQFCMQSCRLPISRIRRGDFYDKKEPQEHLQSFHRNMKVIQRYIAFKKCLFEFTVSVYHSTRKGLSKKSIRIEFLAIFISRCIVFHHGW